MKHDLTEIIIAESGSCPEDGTNPGNSLGVYNRLFKAQNIPDLETRVSLALDHGVIFTNEAAETVTLDGNRPDTAGKCRVIDTAVEAMTAAGARYASISEDEHPGKVIFVITAFGRDNASCHNTYEKLHAMTQHQLYVYKWKFFLLTNDVFVKDKLMFSDEDTVFFDCCDPDFFEAALGKLSGMILRHRGVGAFEDDALLV